MEETAEDTFERSMDRQDQFSQAMSVDMFEDDFVIESDGMDQISVEVDVNSQNSNCDAKKEDFATELDCWRGKSLSNLSNIYTPVLPPVAPSSSHAVFFELPVQNGCLPKPYPSRLKDKWDSNHVRMPCSPLSMYPVQCNTAGGKAETLRPRWDIIEEILLKPITSSHQLQEAIFTYNTKYDYWDFSTLHSFCTEYMSSVESARFFSHLLPMMIRLALQLPTLVTNCVPLLTQHSNHSISLSQQQIACLLANAFLCTFPRRNTTKRNSEYSNYPDINFSRLFSSVRKNSTCVLEKLQCIIHYFWRVCTKMPEGVVTFSRQYMPQSRLPVWSGSKKLLPQLHISSSGTIEDQGDGCLQVDFANKKVGGGVLRAGCVQEEIRFVICPELLVARLFTQELDSTEALLIVGCERYSSYTGYGDSFKWAGNYEDSTPRDSSGRRMCAIVAIDALLLDVARSQFAPACLQRELNKAYAGFYSSELPAGKLCPVATGNWGCGAFRGDSRLKSLLQLMAAGEAGRDVAYFTFGDTQLRDDVFEIQSLLVKHGITIGEVWQMLVLYNQRNRSEPKVLQSLYPYLRKSVIYRTSSGRNLQEETTPSSSVRPVVQAVNQSTKCDPQRHVISTPSRHKYGQKRLSTEDLTEALSLFMQEQAENDKTGSQEENVPKKEAVKEERSQGGRLMSFLDDCDRKAQKKIVDYFHPK